MDQLSNEDFSKRVADVMDIEDVTWGEPKIPYWQSPEKGYIVRFRGNLRMDRSQASDRLGDEFTRHQISAIVQEAQGRHSIILIQDPFSGIISEFFSIEKTQWAEEANSSYIVRFLGRLEQDSILAYDQISARVAEKEVTLLFRREEGRHAVILLKGRNRPGRSNPWLNLVLFLLTVLSTLYIGAISFYDGPQLEQGEFYTVLLQRIWTGWPFALGLLSILLAHEFGHYFAGRIHKAAVTLPYFIPLPIPPFGTLGAFIQLKDPPKNKRVLLDIGVAGPLAGLVVAIVVLLIGLSNSEVHALSTDDALMLEGNSILYFVSKYLVFGELLPAPETYGNANPVLFWVRYFFTGSPPPLGGRDVLIHPLALAGWGGVLVTSLNLIPAGQLDGGHLIYVLLGRKARRLRPYILIALFILGFAWNGWWLWALIIYMLGRVFAEPLDQITELDSRRRAIAILGLIIFALTFTPIPLQVILPPG